MTPGACRLMARFNPDELLVFNLKLANLSWSQKVYCLKKFFESNKVEK